MCDHILYNNLWDAGTELLQYHVGSYSIMKDWLFLLLFTLNRRTNEWGLLSHTAKEVLAPLKAMDLMLRWFASDLYVFLFFLFWQLWTIWICFCEEKLYMSSFQALAPNFWNQPPFGASKVGLPVPFLCILVARMSVVKSRVNLDQPGPANGIIWHPCMILNAPYAQNLFGSTLFCP